MVRLVGSVTKLNNWIKDKLTITSVSVTVSCLNTKGLTKDYVICKAPGGYLGSFPIEVKAKEVSQSIKTIRELIKQQVGVKGFEPIIFNVDGVSYYYD